MVLSCLANTLEVRGSIPPGFFKLKRNYSGVKVGVVVHLASQRKLLGIGGYKKFRVMRLPARQALRTLPKTLFLQRNIMGSQKIVFSACCLSIGIMHR